MIQALIPQLVPILNTVLDKTIKDKDLKIKTMAGLELAIIANAHTLNLETIKTNQVEASHRSIWVAGWRPALGWSLAFGVFWILIGFPMASWVASLTGFIAPLPELPTEILFELTLAMLGMSAVRSFDKLKGLTQ